MYQRSSASRLNIRWLVKGERRVAELSSFSFWSGCDQSDGDSQSALLVLLGGQCRLLWRLSGGSGMLSRV
jgi:hypothetical protein